MTAPVPVLTTINVSLSAMSLQVGQTATASATGEDQNGASIATGAVTWSSSATAVATISAGGAITVVGAGQTQITATVGSLSGHATLSVINRQPGIHALRAGTE
ncbi:MAG TPA: Ig-like domain-containing protein [Gemmatimonadaceae bacterium]